nr:translation initiation factor IF-2-like [Symphalangus syndactylus]XP_055133171.1 translation initiation factor IF-2-like [Symphalangus syndactylus]XP_055133172.1 translation initiation factor IF-2-like [Symphalangus syndactylus]
MAGPSAWPVPENPRITALGRGGTGPGSIPLQSWVRALLWPGQARQRSWRAGERKAQDPRSPAQRSSPPGKAAGPDRAPASLHPGACSRPKPPGASGFQVSSTGRERRRVLTAAGGSPAPSQPLHAFSVEGRGPGDPCKRLRPQSPAPLPRSPSPALRPHGRFRHRGRHGLQRSACVSGHPGCAGGWTGSPQTCVVGLRPPKITQAACARPHHSA